MSVFFHTFSQERAERAAVALAHHRWDLYCTPSNLEKSCEICKTLHEIRCENDAIAGSIRFIEQGNSS